MLKIILLLVSFYANAVDMQEQEVENRHVIKTESDIFNLIRQEKEFCKIYPLFATEGNSLGYSETRTLILQSMKNFVPKFESLCSALPDIKNKIEQNPRHKKIILANLMANFSDVVWLEAASFYNIDESRQLHTVIQINIRVGKLGTSNYSKNPLFSIVGL